MSDQQLADDIRATAEVIKERGWNQGEYINEQGNRCILGAAHVATNAFGPLVHWKRYENLKNHLIDVIAERGDVEVVEYEGAWGARTRGIRSGSNTYVSVIDHFNDFWLKSKEEALEFLDKAAIAAEEKA